MPLHLWLPVACRQHQVALVQEHFSLAYSDVGPSDCLMYGNYLVPGAEPKVSCCALPQLPKPVPVKYDVQLLACHCRTLSTRPEPLTQVLCNVAVQVYQQVTDLPALSKLMETYLEDFNSTTTNPMKLVLFTDAMEHVSRISRIISQPFGNALLLGVGCSGRRSLARLAAFMCDYEVFQVEIRKNYGNTEWKEVSTFANLLQSTLHVEAAACLSGPAPAVVRYYSVSAGQHEHQLASPALCAAMMVTTDCRT